MNSPSWPGVTHTGRATPRRIVNAVRRALNGIAALEGRIDMPDTNTTTNPNRLTPWRSLTPDLARAVWQRCRDNPIRAAKVAALRERIEAGTYDTPARVAVAVENLMADQREVAALLAGNVDIVARPNVADAIAQQMDQEHGDEQRGDRENFGCSADEEAEWERRNVGDRFE